MYVVDCYLKYIDINKYVPNLHHYNLWLYNSKYQVAIFKIEFINQNQHLGQVLKVVSLLSTLRDPTQVRRQRCTIRQYPKEFGCFYSFKITYAPSSQISTNLAFGICHLALGNCLIAHQKERIDRTKKVQLAAKKSSARDQRISCIFLGS